MAYRVPSRSTYGRDITKRPGSGVLAKNVFVCITCGTQHIQTSKPDKCKNRLCSWGLSFERFQSIDEATRSAQLKLLLKLGKITELRSQVRYDLLAYGPKGEARKVAVYVADFVYRRDGKLVIEDVKGGGVDRFAALKMQWMDAMGKPITVVRLR